MTGDNVDLVEASPVDRPVPSGEVRPDIADLPPHIVLYDGVCGLCARAVRRLMDLDSDRRLHFAPLQGATAARLGLQWTESTEADADDTVVFVDLTGDAIDVRERSSAVAGALEAADAAPALRFLLRWTPRAVADACYRFIARRRYRIFGRFDSCRLPTQDERAQLLP